MGQSLETILFLPPTKQYFLKRGRISGEKISNDGATTNNGQSGKNQNDLLS